MRIEQFIMMRSVCMTRFTGSSVYIIGRHRIEFSTDVMICCGMTCSAFHIHSITGHMHIHFPGATNDPLFKIPMFYIITPAAIKMTCTAISFLRITNMLGYFSQIYFSIRVAGHRRSFNILFALIMTNHTIDILFIIEVEMIITHSKTNVAFGTSLLITFCSYTKVIEYIFLAQTFYSSSFNIRYPFPVPVRRSHDFLMRTVMTGQTGARNFLGTLKFFLKLGE